ncbi:hypothetical protein GDO78_001232, partial [Eleutherodactylus coqui]
MTSRPYDKPSSGTAFSSDVTTWAERLAAWCRKMAAPLSQQLESLLNPQPRFWDPEDDPDEVTVAKVIPKFDEGVIDDDDVILGSLKKNAVSYLSDTDKKYFGKATSRKDLKTQLGEDSFSEVSDDLSQEDGYDGAENILRNVEDDMTDEEEVNSEEEEEEEEEEEDDGDGLYSAQQDTDESETRGQNDIKGSEFQDDTVQTFSKEKVSADVAKGQGIKNQT